MRPLMLFGVLVATLVWPVTILAQDPYGSPVMDEPIRSVSEPGDGRNGLLVGLDVFAGDGLESEARLAAGLGVRVGWMMSPVLALMLDTHGAAVGSSQILATDVESTILVRSLAAASVQWWPTRRFWLRGGMGPGRVEGMTAAVGFTPGIEAKETKSGFGATLATGFELYQGPLFALDAHARYTGIRAGGAGYSNLVVGVGFGWYAHVAPPPGPQAAKPKRDRWRNRWVLGVDALGGWPINNDCADCYWNMGAGADFQVGRMITPRLGLMLDTHAVAVGRSEIEGYDDAEANAKVQGIVALAAQYWTSRRTWIKGGFGRGEARESVTVSSPEGDSFDITETETGFGILAAAGYELYQGRALGASVHARYAGIFGGNLSRASVVLGLGVAWFP